MGKSGIVRRTIITRMRVCLILRSDDGAFGGFLLMGLG